MYAPTWLCDEDVIKVKPAGGTGAVHEGMEEDCYTYAPLEHVCPKAGTQCMQTQAPLPPPQLLPLCATQPSRLRT
jgi:hypothetical protein